MDTSQLKRIPLFADVPDEDLRIVATFAESEEFPEGATLMKEGGYSNEFMAIEEGAAEVRHGGEKVAELGPGDIFGEAGVLGKATRSATVVTTERTRVIKIKRWELLRMERKLPHLVDQLRSHATERSAGDEPGAGGD
jgi:CRP/FNR family cyclic AMP-dependent transcriptional regulator